MNMKKGFTLIEIMIVVAIIAILAAIAIPNFISYRQTAQLNACKSNINTLNGATEAWRIKEDKKNDETPTIDLLVKGGYLKAEPTCKLDSGNYVWTNTAWSCSHKIK